MGGKKTQEVTTNQQQNQQFQNQYQNQQQSNQQGLSGGIHETQSQENARSRQVGSYANQGVSEQEQQGRTQTSGNQNISGTTNTTGTTNTFGRSNQNVTGTNTQEEQSRNTSRGTNESVGQEQQQYNYQWVDRPDSADIAALRAWDPGSDPSIPYRFAKNRERLLNSFQNPLGSYATPEMREAQTRAGLEKLSQEEGEAYQEDAYQKQQQKLGQLTSLAQMTQPIRELLSQAGTSRQTGTQESVGESTGRSVGTSNQNIQGTSEQTSQQQQQQQMQQQIQSFQDAITQMFSQGRQAQTGQQVTDTESEAFRNELGRMLGFTQNQEQGSSSGSQSGQSSGQMTGNQTTTQPSNFWGNLMQTGAQVGLMAL